jgi:hypothetical protein
MLTTMAHGSWLGALGVLAFAKMLSVGVRRSSSI